MPARKKARVTRKASKTRKPARKIAKKKPVKKPEADQFNYGVAPILTVTDMERSIAFYQDQLGFDVPMILRDPQGKAQHAILNRGNAMLMIGPEMASAEKPALSTTPKGFGVELYVNLTEIDNYYEQVRSKGVTIREELKDQFWGDRTFSLDDPDGYHLTFAKNIRKFDPEKDVSWQMPAGAI